MRDGGVNALLVRCCFPIFSHDVVYKDCVLQCSRKMIGEHTGNEDAMVAQARAWAGSGQWQASMLCREAKATTRK